MDEKTKTEPADRQPVRQTLVDYLVSKAKSEGAFENLPGAGRPIPDLDEPYDELWWAKKLIEREELKTLMREANKTDLQSKLS